MNQQKGFSLTEVLTSLLLVTTLALALLQQQWQSKYLLNQLVHRSQNTQLRDQIEEALLIPLKRSPPIPYSYPLQMQYKIIKHIRLKKLRLTAKRGFIGSSI